MSLLQPEKRQEYVEATIRANIRQEQVERERQQAEFPAPNVRFFHDPYWRSRFWSIQHIRDVQEGKVWHWFWSPFKSINSLAQVAFIAWPVMFYARDVGVGFVWWKVVLLFAGIELVILAFQNSLEYIYWWRFNRIKRKLVLTK